jgi:hypothetical protein
LMIFYLGNRLIRLTRRFLNLSAKFEIENQKLKKKFDSLVLFCFIILKTKRDSQCQKMLVRVAPHETNYIIMSGELKKKRKKKKKNWGPTKAVVAFPRILNGTYFFFWFSNSISTGYLSIWLGAIVRKMKVQFHWRRVFNSQGPNK